jgi:hypothetical protein
VDRREGDKKSRERATSEEGSLEVLLRLVDRDIPEDVLARTLSAAHADAREATIARDRRPALMASRRRSQLGGLHWRGCCWCDRLHHLEGQEGNQLDRELAEGD